MRDFSAFHRPRVELRTDLRWGDSEDVAYVAAAFDLLQTRQLVNVTAEHAQTWAWTASVSGLIFGTDVLLGMIIQLDQGAGSTLVQRRILRAPPSSFNPLDGYAEESGIAIGNALVGRLFVGVVSGPLLTPRSLRLALQVSPITLAPGAAPPGLV